jgi:hypothetical protein
VRNHRVLNILLAMAVIFGVLKVEITYSGVFAVPEWVKSPAPIWIMYSDGREIPLYRGESYIFFKSCRVEYGMDPFSHPDPLLPERHVKISLADLKAVRGEPVFVLAALSQRRRIILNFPPVSSPWHLPAGVSQLTALLRVNGHEVVQHYGHIEGLEYVLREAGGEEIDRALSIIRNPQSSIQELYAARMVFEHVSAGIGTPDKFIVARNNAIFVSRYYDGTVERLLEAVKNREQHLWYDYFMKVEVPRALDFRSDLYGISIVDERQLVQGLTLASLVKDAMPDCLVVLGGNFWPRVTGAFRLPEFARIFDYCDAVVYREGFQPLQQLAATLNPTNASGTVWRDGSKVVVNLPTLNPTEFESLPTPNFDGGALQWSPDVVPSLYTMSNCPSRCGFCATPAGSDTFLQRPRAMSPRRIAEHMATIGAARFEICDEHFSILRQNAVGKALSEIGYTAEWECYLTANNQLLDPAVCEKLYDAGCRAVQLGLESLSSETLRREHKVWNSPENYGRILANLRAAGIQTHVFLIVGIPGEPLHWGLKWLPFLEDHGRNILTIKSGRYRLPRLCRDEQEGAHSDLIEVLPDAKPLHPNRDFRYRFVSRKKVEAMRDILEEACRRHWAYGVTSVIPWWVNRGRFSWVELEQMAKELSLEPEVRHLQNALIKTKTIVRDELGQNVGFNNFNDLLKFSRTLI